MPPSVHSPARHTLRALRGYVHGLRTEGTESGRDSIAAALGVFIGCLPIYGLHFLVCIGTAKALGLNRLKVYVAANISNPLIAPVLLLIELQAGALIRRGSWHALTLQSVRDVDPWVYGLDILVGSLAVGLVLSGAVFAATKATMRRANEDPLFSLIVRRASDRYVRDSLTAWEFARAKLRLDPVYRHLLAAGTLPHAGTLLDVGCGQGLSLAVLIEGADSAAESARPGETPPLGFDCLVGIDTRPRVVNLARAALGDRAQISCVDARAVTLERCSAVLLFDVLQMIPASAQDALLAGLYDSLTPGGVLLVREVDAAAGLRFWLVRTGNALKALASGRWQETFHFRAKDAWLACFTGVGFHAQVWPVDDTAKGNILFRLVKPDASRTRL